MPEKVSSIIVTYNPSIEDIMKCVEMLLKQQGIEHKIIIVDNNSQNRELIKTKLNDLYQEEMQIIHIDAINIVRSQGHVFAGCFGGIDYFKRIYLILNNRNSGYSGGNNIGIRLSEVLHSNYALIINPDVEMSDRFGIKKMIEVTKRYQNTYVVGPKVLNVLGKNESPLREPTFLEELTWFLNKILKRTFILDVNYESIVPKVSGCCMLLKIEPHDLIDYFDEKVFLYCEEAILSKKVYKKGGNIVFTPDVVVKHKHKLEESACVKSSKMIFFLKSRLYYIFRFSGYSLEKKALLLLSYVPLMVFHLIRIYLCNFKKLKKLFI